jgi:hypothetical protein
MQLTALLNFRLTGPFVTPLVCCAVLDVVRGTPPTLSIGPDGIVTSPYDASVRCPRAAAA